MFGAERRCDAFVVRVDVRMDMDLSNECGLLDGWREGGCRERCTDEKTFEDGVAGGYVMYNME